MCCNGKDYITIRVGCRGCGKSERARKLLGMTHEEYAKHGKFIVDLLESERKHRELMEKLASAIVGELIIQASEEILHDKKRR